MTESRQAELAESLDRVLARLRSACRAAGRAPEDVLLLPITKFHPATDVEILFRQGCREFGEAREPEAGNKVDAVRDALGQNDIRWHMVGRLQRNKARSVARWAHTVHSVDSPRLATALAKAVDAEFDAGRVAPLRAFVQASLDDDPARGGAVGDDLLALAEQVAAARHLRLCGLMAIAPLEMEPARAFERLAREHARVLAEHPDATELSAGMSGDLEEAVKHGSTCVRVGTALLGPRPITSQ